MTARRVLVACGTRPEFVKLASVVRSMRAAGHLVRVVSTGQHFDRSMADDFFEELGFFPDEQMRLEGDEASRLGELTTQAERELSSRRPDILLLLGDTNTVPAYALAARRRGIPVAHLEAGLRSFNETSMEEINRKVAAAAATLQLAPTELARSFLLAEGTDESRIEVVGNPIIDTLVERGISRVAPSERAGVLVTAHRASNVDDSERLGLLVRLVSELAELDPVVFPVHPRTRARLDETGLSARLVHPRVELREPLGYAEMLDRLARARVVVTDSGGVQEEASYLGVPVVVLRRSTPRWEGVALGSARLVGLDVDAALDAARHFAEPSELGRIAALECPYGDGRTGERVAELLGDDTVFARMVPRERDLRDFVPPELVPARERRG